MSRKKKKHVSVDSAAEGNSRRSFVVLGALATGALATLTPLVVGLRAFFAPLAQTSKRPKVRVALLSQVPDDGMPRNFPVKTDRIDAWTKYPAQRIGSVYLIRQPGAELPRALSAKCPHAGCFVGYTSGDELFRCPCHTSAFKLDGSRARGDAEVAPRGMDELPVELRSVAGADGTQEVWVEFIDFQTGHKEAIPTV